MNIEDMNKDERSLLLYFETAAVDYGGKLDARRMNDIDFANARQWSDEGFIHFGRIKASDIAHNFDHWCILTEAAWTEAHQERRARNVRVEGKLDIHRNGYDQKEYLPFDEAYVFAGGDF